MTMLRVEFLVCSNVLVVNQACRFTDVFYEEVFVRPYLTETSALDINPSTFC